MIPLVGVPLLLLLVNLTSVVGQLSRSSQWPKVGFDTGQSGQAPYSIGSLTNPEFLWSVHADSPVQTVPVITTAKCLVKKNSIFKKRVMSMKGQ